MRRLLCFLIVGMTCVTGVAWGSAITLTSNLPPDSGEYTTPALSYQFGPLVVLQDFRLHSFTNITHPSCGAGCERDQFSSVVDANLFVNGIPQGHIVLSGPGLFQDFGYNVGTPGNPFSIELLQLDLSGGGIFVRESPTLQSVGQDQIDNLGNGTFRISSFFDVFTELSLDNGATWIPQSNGSSRVTLVAGAVPEPPILLLTGIAFAGIGFCSRRRRPSVARSRI